MMLRFPDARRTNRVLDTIGVPHIPVGRDQREPLQGHAARPLAALPLVAS